MRAMWTGSISFGLVNVPVRLFAATERRDVRFGEFERATGAKVHHRRIAGLDDHEVPVTELVKGVEVGDGRYVFIESDELDAVAASRTDTIDIEDFVALEEIDPVYFDRSYYVGPKDGAGAAKPYALLLDALARNQRIAIGRFVLRNRERLVAIRAAHGVLLLETLHYPDEIRDPGEVEGVPGADLAVAERERDLADLLVEAMTAPWQPERYHDRYRERVDALVEAKARGESVTVDTSPPLPPTADLLAALRSSVEEAQRDRPGSHTTGSGSPRRRRRKAPDPADAHAEPRSGAPRRRSS